MFVQPFLVEKNFHCQLLTNDNDRQRFLYTKTWCPPQEN
jgi:hypothetical protein